MAKKQEPNQGLQELKAALSRKETCGAYVFYGEEVFLMHYYLDRLKKLAIDEVTESFNFHELNPETFSMDALSEAVEALPMMAEQTMTVVDEVDFFAMDEGSRERMGAIFNDLPDYCTLVFTYETTPWKPDKRYKKLWEAVSKHAKLVEFPKQDRRELVSWVIRHFSARGKVISQQLAGYLIDLTDGTMTALSGEIAKIAAFSGAQEIVKADIDAVTEPVLDAVVFQMTDLMAAREFRRSALEAPAAFQNAAGAHRHSRRRGQLFPAAEHRPKRSGKRRRRGRRDAPVRRGQLPGPTGSGGLPEIFQGILPESGGTGAGNGLCHENFL